MATRKRSSSAWIGGALAVAIIVGAGLWLRQLPWRADFSTWPPAGVFRMVMGEPPPVGVTEVRAAGRHYFTKRWVWMRFQASDSAMHSLAALGESVGAAQARQLLRQRWSANVRYDGDDRRRVGWPGAAALAGLPTYEFYTGSTSTWLWHGVIVLDRRSHTVYVTGSGD